MVSHSVLAISLAELWLPQPARRYQQFSNTGIGIATTLPAREAGASCNRILQNVITSPMAHSPALEPSTGGRARFVTDGVNECCQSHT